MKMLSIKVLGPGCANCKSLEKVVQKTVAAMALEANVEKVTQFQDIMKYAILATPGLVINEKVVCAGRVPSEAEVSTWLSNAALDG
jgi:small redox-active disulfide protein 2